MKVSPNQKPRGRHPHVEPLEQRIVLTSNLRISPSGGDWNIADRCPETCTPFLGVTGYADSFHSAAMDTTNDEEMPSSAATLFTNVGDAHRIQGKETFTDGDGDLYTLSLKGPGSLDFSQGADGGIALLNLTDTTAKSSLSITVKKMDGGDGKVSLDRLIADGSLGSLSALAVTLRETGISIAGKVGKLALGDVVDGADLHLGGSAADKTVILLGIVGNETDIKIGASITSLTAKSLGDGAVHAPALGKLTTTAGGIASNLTIAGAVGNISAKGDAEGVWTASKFGALSVSGGDFAANAIATSTAISLGKTASIKRISVSGGDLTGNFTAHGNVGAVSVKASKSGVGGEVIGSRFDLDLGGLKSLQAGSISQFDLHAGSAGKLSSTNGALDADLTLAGAVGGISTKGGGASGDWSVSRLGAISVRDGSLLVNLYSTLNVAKVTVIGGSAGGQWDANGFGALSVTGGTLSANITAFDKIASITVKGGSFSGSSEAGSIGKVSISGGDFSGRLYAEMLSFTTTIAGVSISGGNLTGDIGSASGLGAVTVKADRSGVGGHAIGANIFAASITSFATSGDLTGTVVLGGANLGSDMTLGGVDAALDTFASGRIGKVTIGGSVYGSIIAAGLSPVDDVLANGNDIIIGGGASAISSLAIAGTADAATYFAAGVFKGTVKIGGMVISPASDGRFYLG